MFTCRQGPPPVEAAGLAWVASGSRGNRPGCRVNERAIGERRTQAIGQQADIGDDRISRIDRREIPSFGTIKIVNMLEREDIQHSLQVLFGCPRQRLRLAHGIDDARDAFRTR